MKKTHFQLAWMIAILTSIQSPILFAEVIQGEIVEVDSQGTFLKVARSDPKTKAAEPESIKIKVNKESRMEGASMADLRPGDEIWADVTKDKKEGSWFAKKIQLDKVDIKTTSGVVDKTQEGNQDEAQEKKGISV